MHSFTPFLRPFVSSAITVPAFCVLYTICTSTTSALRELFLYLPSARFFPSTIHSFSPHFRSTFLRFKTIVYFEMCVCFLRCAKPPMADANATSNKLKQTTLCNHFHSLKSEKKDTKTCPQQQSGIVGFNIKTVTHTHTQRKRKNWCISQGAQCVFFLSILWQRVLPPSNNFHTIHLAVVLCARTKLTSFIKHINSI